MTAPLRTRLTPQLQVFVSLLWGWFLIWSVLALVIMPWSIGSHQVSQWVGDPASHPLAATLELVLRYFDFVWVVLGVALLYVEMIMREGLAQARRGSLIVFGVCAAVILLNAVTGFPLGAFVYTTKLGLRVADLMPPGVLLLWYLVIVSSRYTAVVLLPRLRRGKPSLPWLLAGVTAFLTLLTDWNLEKIALHVRLYWRWPLEIVPAPEWPPLSNFVAWFLVAFVVALLLGPTRQPRPGSGPLRLERPLVIFCLFNLVLGAIHLWR